MSEELFAVQMDDMYEETAQNESVKKYLTFISENLNYAISAQNVKDIITNYVITRLPMVPSYIKGVMNLRGQITPVVDIRLLMGRTECENSEKACIIVVEINEISLGILVDEVLRVVDLDEDAINIPPHNVNDQFVNGIINIDSVPNLIVDCKKLVKNK